MKISYKASVLFFAVFVKKNKARRDIGKEQSYLGPWLQLGVRAHVSDCWVCLCANRSCCAKQKIIVIDSFNHNAAQWDLLEL